MQVEVLEKISSQMREEEIIELIKAMVSIPSYRGIAGQETGVAEYIGRFFAAEGIEVQVIPVVDGRSNAVARLRGTGGGRSLLLTGHTDTVPPYDMPGDPFTVKVADGKLFGRGVVDMKGALACMMLAMAAIKRAGVRLAGDLIFAAVIDEEDKSEGTRALLKSGLTADAAVVGEPTELDINIGHRGLEWFEFHFQGKTVHGGKQKEGINAIAKAAKFIQRVEEELLPKIEGRVHPVIGASSMNYGLIKGGTQPSTVAGECILQVDRRWIPGERYEDIIKEYQDILDALHREDPQFNGTLKVMDVSLMEDFVHAAAEIDPDHPIIGIAEDSIRSVTGRRPKKVPFTAWTDAGLLSSYGKIPSIILGPGNLESAHSAGEFLEVAQVFPAAAIYVAIAVQFCGGFPG